MDISPLVTQPENVQVLVIEAVKNGDRDAYNSLVVKYQESIFKLALYLLSDPADTEDATQAAFLSAFLHLNTYRGGSFKAWILRIAANICYDQLRLRKRHPAISMDDQRHALDENLHSRIPNSYELVTEDAIYQADMLDSLQDCLDRLPDDYRMATLLVDIDGMDYREASEVISRPVGTVKSRVARARMQLRR